MVKTDDDAVALDDSNESNDSDDDRCGLDDFFSPLYSDVHLLEKRITQEILACESENEEPPLLYDSERGSFPIPFQTSKYQDWVRRTNIQMHSNDLHILNQFFIPF